MVQKTDRRIRKTKKQLRQGLAKLMENKSINEITVKELVEEVDINRSTFYLHYTDIYDMLQKIEEELMQEIVRIISPPNELQVADTFPYIINLFTMLENNRDICKALLGPHGDMAFINKIEEYIGQNSALYFTPYFPKNMEQDLKYIYSYYITGCIGLVKTWILNDNKETPEHMAQLTFKIVNNSLNALTLEENSF